MRSQRYLKLIFFKEKLLVTLAKEAKDDEEDFIQVETTVGGVGVLFQ